MYILYPSYFCVASARSLQRRLAHRAEGPCEEKLSKLVMAGGKFYQLEGESKSDLVPAAFGPLGWPWK